MDQEDDNIVSSEGAAEATVSETVLFAELKQTNNCISQLTSISSDLPIRNQALSELRRTFDKYLEFPTLLDRHVEPMVTQLAQAARSLLEATIISNEDNDSLLLPFWETPLAHILSAIYALSKVRGRKRVQKFLPHEVNDVEVVFKVLEGLEKDDENQLHQSTAIPPTDGPQKWESVYTLWNWMGMLSLVPFDSSVVTDSSLINSLIVLGESHLSHAGPTREMAASCLASWLSRPDLETTQLPLFIEWSKERIDEFTTDDKQSSNQNRHLLVFQTMGALQTLVTILKVSTADRTSLIQLMTPPLWDSTLVISESKPSNSLLRKILVKWWTRLGCAHLPPRIAPWRYQRGRRSLKENLQAATTIQSSSSTTKQGADSSVDGTTTSSSSAVVVEEDDLFQVPDQVEDSMGQVIDALTDSSTVVRWSAAKGIGRITERLPAICAEDVLDALLELFDDIEKDHAWHGACLALAELARRGLLLPHRLMHVMPRMVQAIQYDVPRRQTSVGSHVRDAACYTYWACARAYAPSILKPFIADLSQSIVVASLLDREVNCRRAASAAFQEFVGRQGADVSCRFGW
jgi:hypothetical protein